ncbi:flagellar brake protein [Anaeromicropila populeti]|uniref:C-di-GMP-binding flagellar brake protein YcgR, contains PilZNR and PilZ domains n=1 Tax=Anaeromicropila populeti TaxID=37658 RepID=A0A1I6KXK0_9FIRM|nr:flagellar brake protein [Anaeromicropila populeti]SFR95931.1 c-di-GMP-binding flagellar brake protein YcgR, contains PilZNR and PilZ domains [Anaeromicropila populeti]
MSSGIFNIGDKIELYKDKEYSEDQIRKKYVSQFLDFEEDEKIKIAMPIESGRLVPLSIGDVYKMLFYTDNGMYQCQGKIVDRFREKNIFFLVVELLTDLERFQRREFYRFECVLNGRCRMISKEEELLLEKLQTSEVSLEQLNAQYQAVLADMESQWNDVVFINLSGGGAKFNSRTRYESGNKLIVQMEIPINNVPVQFELRALIVASEAMFNRSGFYETRIKFLKIGKKEREDIIKFIFEEERRQRQRKKGMV